MPLFIGHSNSGSTGSGISNHEALTGLLGGDINGHYHLTHEQLQKLRQLLQVLQDDKDLQKLEQLLQLQDGSFEKLEQLLQDENFEKLEQLLKQLLENGDIGSLQGVGLSIVKSIIIPSNGWIATEPSMPEHTDYAYYQDVTLNGVKQGDFPVVSLHIPSLGIAGDTGICPTIQALDGVLRFWACEVPPDDMTATVAILTHVARENNSSEGMELATLEEIAALFQTVDPSKTSITTATLEEVGALFNP